MPQAVIATATWVKYNTSTPKSKFFVGCRTTQTPLPDNMAEAAPPPGQFDLPPALAEALDALSRGIEEKVPYLASRGDEELANLALATTKQIFDMGKFHLPKYTDHQPWPSSHTLIRIFTHFWSRSCNHPQLQRGHRRKRRKRSSKNPRWKLLMPMLSCRIRPCRN